MRSKGQKGQGNWERKCKNRFSHISLSQSGSIYVKRRPKWSAAYFT